MTGQCASARECAGSVRPHTGNGCVRVRGPLGPHTTPPAADGMDQDQDPARTLGLPRLIPCPRPGLDGAKLKSAKCSRLAELMATVDGWRYWCPNHGAIPIPEEARP
jgi:hypothetical protein